MNVLLLPDTGTADAVAELLTAWSSSRLLRPFCLWTAGEAETVRVRRIFQGSSEELLLGDALAAADPSEIEFVAFYPLAAGEAAEIGFSAAVERFLAAAALVLDFDPDRPVACAFAVAPSAPEQLVKREVFRSGWANFLVAPEDRASPGAVNQLEGGADRFLRHAAHAAATIASAWVVPSEHCPQLLAKIREEPIGPLRVKVRVLRCFSRIVELGHIADHIAGVAFEPQRGWPPPGREFVRPADPGPLVAKVSRAYLESHRTTLERRPFRPITEDRPPPLGLLEAILKLIEQAVAYLRRLPSELIEEAIRNIHEKAAQYIAELSGRSVDVRRWNEVDEEHDFSGLSKRLDKSPLVIEDGDVAPTWRDLRRTVLALVDGSDLPEAIQPSVRAPGDRRLTIGDPTRLARDPKASEPSFEPLLQQIRVEVFDAAAAARERADLLAEVEAWEEDEDEAEAGSERGILRRLLRGGGRLLATARRIGTYALLALLAMAVAWSQLAPLESAVATIAIAAAWFLVSARLARQVLRLPRIPEDERAKRGLRELNRILERAQARGDAERLQRRLDELDAWIEILAELLHRPWVREPFDGLDLVHTTDEETLPAASAVGVSRPGQELLERVGRSAQAKTFNPGWLSSIYRSVEERTMNTYYLDRGGIGALPSPLDVSSDEESPLQALLLAVHRGDGRNQRDNPMADELLAAIDAALLDELAPEVMPISRDLRPLGPTAIWILPPEGFAAVAEDCGNRIVGLRGWRATATIVAPGVALTAASVATDRLLAVVLPDRTTAEVAEVTLPAGSGLALLRLEADVGAGFETTVAPAQFGTGVVALDAVADGTRLRWGFVTDDGDELAVVYDGGSPGVGAPVFDLAGRLIAVQGERGVLLRVPAIDELLEMKLEEGVSVSPFPTAMTEPATPPVPASAFLAAIASGNGPGELLPAYWLDPVEVNEVEFSLPPGLLGTEKNETVGQLSGGAAFLRPLRVIVQRVEVTQPVEPGELAACWASR